MRPEQWEHLEDILTRALEASGAARARVLAECGADAELRSEIESLLAEHEREPDYLQQSPVWLAAFESSATEELPARIGEYRILRLIGRGGMGQVYLAERQAQDFRQEVALKVMRRGMDTADLLARFRLERQILASLNHPNIARLYDVGATESGHPYLVMEYIDGVPLLEYCDAQRLGLNDRLRLFQHICAAVQHAHQSLIVHRDIKPSNILVSADGAPKLLDFGIAKIITPQPDEARAQLTRAELRLLTPEYSSPEQIRGEPVTTACDVYALGVLLYQLLAGRHPLADAQTTRLELERRILEQEPPAPSVQAQADAAAARGLSLAQLRRSLQGDLNTVTLKAQRKEPGARYASALSLSEDLARHLGGLPVQARPATLRYRVRKFVARNRIGVSAAALLAAILVGATAVTLYQSRRIQQESARTLRERDKALQVSSFLLEMFGTTGPDQPTGDTVTARQLLDRRAATVRTAYSNDAELRAEMMHVLAEGYEKLGLLDQAEPLAQEALETRRTMFGAQHADIVASLNLLGWLRHRRSNLEAADTLLRQAVAMGRRVFAAPGDARLARALNDLGVVREAKADYDEAAELYRESLDMRRRVQGDQNVGVAITTSNLSVVLYRRGDLKGATEMAQSALDAFRRILGDDHARTSVVQRNLATMWGAMGDHARAAQELRQILERRKRQLGPRHADVAFTMSLLANELRLGGQFQEAEALALNALELHRSAEGVSPDHLASTLRVIANVYRFSNRHDQALRYYNEALSMARRIYGSQNWNVADLLYGSSESYNALGQNAPALAAMREALQIGTAVLAPGHTFVIRARVSLAGTLLQQGLREPARQQLDAAEQALATSKGLASDSLRMRVVQLRAALGQ